MLVVANEDGAERAYAADSLGEFAAAEAADLLVQALAAETGGHHRRLIATGLLATRGVAPETLALALETYAKTVSTPSGARAWRSCSLEILIAKTTNKKNTIITGIKRTIIDFSY
jgi:hypothetical protein